MSTKVSEGLFQNTAAVWDAEWPTRKGMEPYSAMGSSSSYSKTSRLYRRYGSEKAPAEPSVALRLYEDACSGMPYTCCTPGKRTSMATAVGPCGLLSRCPPKDSSHAPSSSSERSAVALVALGASPTVPSS